MSAPQGTEAWLAERAGHCTASRACDVLAKVKTGEAATRRKYRIELLTERLTGNTVEHFQSASMKWGTETEPLARMAFESATGALVEEVGFVKHPRAPWVGASPDGTIDDDGLLEIKCPDSTTHIEWRADERVPPQHVAQIQFQLWVTGRKWCQFVSFDPRFPRHLQLFIVNVPRDDAYIETLSIEVGRFNAEVQRLYDALMEKPCSES